VLTSVEVTAHEQEAFGWAVRVVRLGDWSAAIPEQPKFEVAGQFLTIRDICERRTKSERVTASMPLQMIYLPLSIGHPTLICTSI
jgi:hypothetical protein